MEFRFAEALEVIEGAGGVGGALEVGLQVGVCGEDGLE